MQISVFHFRHSIYFLVCRKAYVFFFLFFICEVHSRICFGVAHSCVARTFASPFYKKRAVGAVAGGSRNFSLEKTRTCASRFLMSPDFVLKCVSTHVPTRVRDFVSEHERALSSRPSTRCKPVSATVVLNRVLTTISETLRWEMELPAIRGIVSPPLFNLIPGRVLSLDTCYLQPSATTRKR